MYEKIENFLKTRPLGIAMYAFVRGLLSIMPLPFHAANMTDMLSYMFILYHDTPSRIDYELPRKFPMIALCIIVASTLTYLFSSLSLPFTTLLNFSYGCFILYSLYGVLLAPRAFQVFYFLFIILWWISIGMLPLGHWRNCAHGMRV